MFSKAALKLLQRTIQVADLWSVLPLKWNQKSGCVEVVKSKRRQVLWLVSFLGLTIHWMFVFTRYINLSILDPTATGPMKVYMEYLAIAYIIPLIFHCTTRWTFHELVHFINEYIHFHKIVKDITRKDLTIRADCDRFLKFMWRAGHCVSWICLIVAYLKPSRPNLLSSLLVDNGVELKLWHRVFLLVPHIWVWWSLWALQHVLSLHSVGSAYVISSSAAHLGDMAKKGRRDARSALRFCRLNRALQILHVQHGVSFGPPIAAHKFPFVLLIIRSVYGALTGEGIVRLLQAAVGLSAWCYLHLAFGLLGSVNETSEDALKELSQMDGNPWFRRFRRSCKPLKVNIGGLYYADKGMPLTLAATIVESTVDLIIAGQ